MCDAYVHIGRERERGGRERKRRKRGQREREWRANRHKGRGCGPERVNINNTSSTADRQGASLRATPNICAAQIERTGGEGSSF